MKFFAQLVCLSIYCFAALAQPTSFGGITPGKTSREELKSLVQETNDLDDKNLVGVKLRQLDGQFATVRLQNDVVYEVVVALYLGPELKSALLEKYGQPKIKAGALKKVTCQNKFGASFERLSGEEEWRWPAKEGVQGAIHRLAGVCSVGLYEDYVLRHVATVKAIEGNRVGQVRKEAEEKRRKLGNAF